MTPHSGLVPTADSVAFAPGLFVIWHAAHSHRRQILDDLYDRFDILGIYEIEWTPSRVMRNFERFYSDLDVRGVYHVFNKGAGPFTAVVVRDPRPRIAVRQTSRGGRTVNANFLNAKQEYRDWTTGLEVHCSETPEEARRDVMMLIGADMNTCQAVAKVPTNHPIEKMQRDVSGSSGWSSANELFSALNESVPYAVLFERGRPRSQLFENRDRPLQIMTADFAALHRILNADPVLPAAPHGGVFSIRVADRRIPVALRFPGDGFVDGRWAQSMLDRRKFDHSGFYRLANDDYFDSLAYHVLAHRPDALSLRDELRIAAHRLERGDWQNNLLSNPVEATRWLDELLERRGYDYSEPLDPAVCCRKPMDASPRPGIAQALSRRGRRCAGLLQASWWQVRDRLLLRFPWLRDLKRQLPRGQHRAPAR